MDEITRGLSDGPEDTIGIQLSSPTQIESAVYNAAGRQANIIAGPPGGQRGKGGCWAGEGVAEARQRVGNATVATSIKSTSLEPVTSDPGDDFGN